MNRLWIRLAIGFMLGGFLGMYIAEELSYELIYNIDEISASAIEDLQRPTGLRDELVTYYADNESWDGLPIFLEDNHVRLQYEVFWKVDILGIAIFGKDDTLLYNSYQSNLEFIDSLDVVHREPLMVDGQVEGYILLLDGISMGFDESYDVYIEYQAVSITGLEVIIWAITSILVAVIVSYLFTRPLNKLAHEVRQFDMTTLNMRIPERGSAEVKSVTKSFNDMATALEHAEELRRSMVADVAHELRTPLSLIQGNLRAILDGVYELNYQEILRVYDQTRLLSRLVNDLHELAQAEARDLKLNREDVELEAIIHDTVGAFQPLAEDHEIKLLIHVTGKLPILQLDRERITQVLHNLLGNAIRHTPSGGQIKIRANVDSQHQLEIVVEDTGEGIPEEHLPYIFNRFYKADKNRERAKGGTGLGLAITRAIIEAHGGTIRALNAAQGAMFVVYLPA